MVRFYTLNSHQQIINNRKLPEGYSLEVWRAKTDGLNLKGLRYRHFAVWWLVDRLGLFSNPFIGAVMIKQGRRIVHHSLVTPKWHRFPDMGSADLQIGNVWTSEDQRGLGLAKIAINEIHRQWATGYAKIWYLVGDDNFISIRLIESCGYQLTALGVRTKPYKIQALGQFRVTRWVSSCTTES